MPESASRGGVPGSRGGVPAWSRGGVPGPGVYLVRYSPLWTEFLTHASEIITLPETSFAGGNYVVLMPHVLHANYKRVYPKWIF